MIVKPLPRRFARWRNRGTTEIVTKANTVVHVEQQHHQQQPEKAQTFIVVNEDDRDNYGERRWSEHGQMGISLAFPPPFFSVQSYGLYVI